ncbi:hypothetical protein NPIL_17511 [Nephila pilipes]|uniref:Uncharacterized protein n=1 Tax=Nephila pilipes TaxID=299642 RepID=A0A8X6NKE1_NEPPI|nr:hypothetical protein NPIL_17511 [Nephila pilipes]
MTKIMFDIALDLILAKYLHKGVKDYANMHGESRVGGKGYCLSACPNHITLNSAGYPYPCTSLYINTVYVESECLIVPMPLFLGMLKNVLMSVVIPPLQCFIWTFQNRNKKVLDLD